MADTTLTLGLPEAIQSDNISVNRSGSTSEVLREYGQTALTSRRQQLTPVLGQNLRDRLLAFRNAIDAFAFPAGSSPLFQGRLAVADGSQSEALSITLPGKNDAIPYYKYYSSGFDSFAKTELDAGKYRVGLSLGEKRDSVTVDVQKDWTNGELVRAFADAVNASKLGVRAHVINQSAPGQVLKGQSAIGLSVALSVNAAHEEQNLSLSNETGRLLSAFDFHKASDPLGPAEVTEHVLSHGRAGRPSSYRTATFDPNAETTMNPGNYQMNWSLGEHSGTFDFAVGKDDTWGDVLRGVVNAASARQYFHAELKTADVPADIPGFDLTREGEYVTFTAVDPKVGERLSIGGGGHLGIGEFSVTEGIDGVYEAIVSKELYAALNTGTVVQVSSTDTLPTGLSPDTDYYAVLQDSGPNGYRIGFAASQADAESGNAIALADAGSGVLNVEAAGNTGVLGLATGRPGTDTVVTVDGRRQTLEAGGLLSLDEGRVLVDVEESFAGPLPLSVEEPMRRMEETLAAVIDEYNTLRSFILANQDLFRDGLAELWRDPLLKRMDVLASAGFSELGERQLLQVAFEDFFVRVVADPEGMRNVMSNDEGLLPDWRREIGSVLDREESWLLPETSVTDRLYPPPNPLTETALETKSRLVDIIDDVQVSARSLSGRGLIDLKG